MISYEVGPEEDVSLAVVRAISDVDGRDALDLPPLWGTVEPHCIDTIFSSDMVPADRTTFEGTMSFRYCDRPVVVRGSDPITVAVGEVGESVASGVDD